MADEYIKREAAYDTLTEYYHHSTDTQHRALREALSRVPAADVVPVVRCKDCKHYQHDAFFDHDWCDGRRVTPDYYCADGERRSMEGGEDDA